MEVKGTLIAMIGKDSYLKPQDLNSERCLPQLTVLGESSREYFTKVGYTEVGSVEVVFRPFPPKDLLSNKIEALKNEAATLRAETTARVTKIEAQIQNLMAIGFDEQSVFDKAADENDIPF